MADSTLVPDVDIRIGPPAFRPEPHRYAQLVFDCDGVIFDSNRIKAANIREAASRYCDGATTTEFVDFFTGNNGLPREQKIRAFFENPEIRTGVLEAYNRLNETTLRAVRPDQSTLEFIARCAASGADLYLLSGGDEAEVRAIVESAGIDGAFREIMGGPTTKVEHLARLSLSGPACFFGDSRYDHEVADRFGLDFVFVRRYTQFDGWREYFDGRPRVWIAHDLGALLEGKGGGEK